MSSTSRSICLSHSRPFSELLKSLEIFYAGDAFFLVLIFIYFSLKEQNEKLSALQIILHHKCHPPAAFIRAFYKFENALCERDFFSFFHGLK